MRFFGRASLFGLGLGTVLVAGGAACIPDPEGEFNDYKERTAGMTQSTQPSTDASIETKPPETATEGLYIGICTTILANNDPNQALRFYTKSKFVPDGAGGGKLTLTVKPMVGWDVENKQYISPKSVSESETRG